jgi:hypothetical protein
MLADGSDRLDLVSGSLEQATPDGVLIPVALVEDEKSVRAAGLDEIAHLEAGEELPTGCEPAGCAVETADSKFVRVHGCLLST